MKLVFAGTPEFAAVSLEALLAARHEVTLVLTQPDRPAGRGLKPQPSPVKSLALERGLRLFQPATLKDPAALETIRAESAEAIVVAAFGQLLPPAVLALPPRGCINVHASLLPRWRGAAPIQQALLAGDAETGVTIMQMDEGLDTGAMLLRRAIPIAPTDTAGSLHDKLAALGAQLLVESLASTPVPSKQDAATATYAPRIRKQDAVIDWQRPAVEIERQIRAFDPVPGAQTVMDGQTYKLWRARVTPLAGGAAGTICQADAEGIVVACGQDALRITELQRAGGRRLPAADFLSGHKLAHHARFGLTHG